MSRYALRSLGADAPAAPAAMPDKAAFLAKYEQAHAVAMNDRHHLLLAISKLQPLRTNLPLGPYPPAGDDSGYPRTGSPQLVVSQSSISQAALAEPGKITKNLANQAAARRPTLNGLFVAGLVALGIGICVLRRE